MPGVKAVLLIAKAGSELRYQGDDIAAVAAETEEQARDAARAIKVDYEVLPHVVTEEQAIADRRAPRSSTGGERRNTRQGAVDQGQPRGGDGQGRRRRSRRPIRCPSSPTSASSPHGLTVQVGGRRLRSSPGRARRPSASRPATWPGTRSRSRSHERHGPHRGHGRRVRLEVRRRRLGPDRGRPLEEGRRPARPDVPRPRPGTPRRRQPPQRDGQGQARRDEGRQARRHDRRDPRHRRRRQRLAIPAALRLRRPGRVAVATPTSSSTAATPGPCGPRAIPRAAPSWKRRWTTWPTSSASTRWSSGSRTSPPNDFKTPIYEAEVKIGGRADRLGRRTASRAGRTARGRSSAASGMAPAHLGRRRHARTSRSPASSTPTAPSRSRSATQDIGTGARTVLAIIAAEVLGLKPTDIKSNIGNSTFPPGQARAARRPRRR